MYIIEEKIQNFTIFIDWSIVVIASCNEGTTSCSSKVSTSMILKAVTNDKSVKIIAKFIFKEIN